jgi:hypothetical protein
VETADRITAVGVFQDRSHAEYALGLLAEAGFTADQIGVVVPDEAAGIEVPSVDAGTRAGEGAALGGAAGVALGGLVGAALASVVIPGVGPVIAAGLLAGALGGAAAGAASGTIVGALVGLEIPEPEAHHYARHFHEGRTLITVRAEGRYDEAVAILQRAVERPEVHVPEHGRGRMASLDNSGGGSSGGSSTFLPGP